MTQTATRKTQKQVKIINRYELKDRTTGKPNGYVVYVVLSSNGEDRYKTTLLNAKATGCSCPATKPCYHMTQLQEREAARTSQAVQDAKFYHDLATGYDAHPWA